MSAVVKSLEELNCSEAVNNNAAATPEPPPSNVVALPTPDQPDGARAKGLFSLLSGGRVPGRELLGNRYLCRQGSLLIVGNTGIGKSSLTMQMMMKWSLGQECFGITPTQPLKSLLIQGENDEEDLAEMRDGVSRSLQWTEVEARAINGNVLVCHEYEHAGEDFVEEIVEPLIERHKPDLVWLDPLFQYLDGDGNNQEVVGRFLRKHVGPVIKRHDCAVVLIHHTSKPSKTQKRSKNHSLQAYDAAGSAEFSNWPRAVLSLQATNTADTYRLVGAKRGNRLGWRTPDGQKPAYEKTLQHSREPGTIFWQEADCSIAVQENATVEAELTDEQLAIAQVPGGEVINKNDLLTSLNGSMGINRARAAVDLAVTNGLLIQTPIVRLGKRPGVGISRPLANPQPQVQAA